MLLLNFVHTFFKNYLPSLNSSDRLIFRLLWMPQSSQVFKALAATLAFSIWSCEETVVCLFYSIQWNPSQVSFFFIFRFCMNNSERGCNWKGDLLFHHNHFFFFCVCEQTIHVDDLARREMFLSSSSTVNYWSILCP